MTESGRFWQVDARYTVRHRLPDGSATDVVGHVRAVRPVLVVERRDGTLVEVEHDDVIIARRVPDTAPPRRPRHPGGGGGSATESAPHSEAEPPSPR